MMTNEDIARLRAALELVNEATKDAAPEIRLAQQTIRNGIRQLIDEAYWLREQEKAATERWLRLYDQLDKDV